MNTGNFMSKKMTKGSLAITAGVVLLLGGAGTYALWEVNAPLDGSVQTGDLNLELDDAAWTLNGASVENVSAVQIAPGDTLNLTQPMTVTVAGDDLTAQLSLSNTDAFIPEELTEHLDVDFDLDASWATETGPDSYLINSGAEARQVSAEVSIAFSENTPDRVGVNTSMDLGALEFTLQQQPSALQQPSTGNRPPATG